MATSYIFTMAPTKNGNQSYTRDSVYQPIIFVAMATEATTRTIRTSIKQQQKIGSKNESTKNLYAFSQSVRPVIQTIDE